MFFLKNLLAFNFLINSFTKSPLLKTRFVLTIIMLILMLMLMIVILIIMIMIMIMVMIRRGEKYSLDEVEKKIHQCSLFFRSFLSSINLTFFLNNSNLLPRQ